MKFSDLKRQFINLIPVFLLVYIPSIVLFCILLVVHFTTDVSFSVFLDDPVSFLNAPSYIGLASNLGILIWCASAAIMIFAYLVLRRKGVANKTASFLLAFGLIGLWLAIDDLYMVHEAVGDGFLAAFGTSDDVGEGATFVVYMLIFFYFVFRYRYVISRTDYLLLASFIILCGINAVFDLAPSRLGIRYSGRIEEIIKFLAIVNWFAYTTRTAFKIMKNPELEY